ncbi:MAG: SIS domain-containing protein [Chloroflexota bacterium]|nr:SIS domain-containing protein [Chloroflexota bacterium]
MDRLPRWAQRLKDNHPDGEMPTWNNPIPAWLEDEVSRVPLWYIIRESSGTRTQHPFLLLDEIRRQPEQWSEILDRYWPAVNVIAERIGDREIEQVIFTGCGSAFFTAIHDAFIMSRFAGLPASAIESFELTNYFPPIDPARTLVVGHSGTGGSIETIQAMETAAQLGCLTLAVTNTEDTGVERASELALIYATHQACGPCISVISTRVLLVTMLTVVLAKQRGRDEAGVSQVERALSQISVIGRQFLEDEEEHVWDLARAFSSAGSFFLVGSGPNYFSAREGTLKIEEQAILVAKAFRPGDFHHGALSLVSPDRVVVAIEAAGAANGRVVDVLRAAREAGSPTVAVLWSGGPAGADLAGAADHRVVLTGSLPELVAPIPMTLVFQLLGYYLGVERGYNPDTLRTDHLPNARAWLTAFPLGTH